MKFLSTVALYVSMLFIGAMLYMVCRPYAMANRVDPSLIGGEALLIFIPAIIALFVRASRF